MGDRVHEWYTGTEEREHLDRRCWCRPAVVHRSKITGGRVSVHRASKGDYPPADVLAIAKWHADSPDVDDDVPGHNLTEYG